jgi:UDP-N-acetylglucosamine diphosphorylase/glucosamine-1-phosphate N-acetyltransferase
MKIFLIDPSLRQHLYPFSVTKSYADFRIGLYTLAERYRLLIGKHVSIYSVMSSKEISVHLDESCLFINAQYVPDAHLVKEILQLKDQEGMMQEKGVEFIALRLSSKPFDDFTFPANSDVRKRITQQQLHVVNDPTDINRLNSFFLHQDMELVDTLEMSEEVKKNNFLYGSGKVIMDPSSVVSGAMINTEEGAIYIGKNCRVMEGACIKGPVAILDGSVVKMGAKIYGATTIGEKCIVGGEIKNTVFFDFSNKAHDGYIGDSVIGSWCNMGAGTSCSNLKNNIGEIYLWNPLLEQNIPAGKKCGVMMGDYTRTAIHTSLNTGTVTGICCNIMTGGFPPKYIADFTWNVSDGILYAEDKFLSDIQSWMELKNEKLTEKDKRLLLQYYHNRLNVNR